MMSYIKYLSGLLITLCLLQGCKQNMPETPVIDYGYEYYPLEVGFWHVYNVDEIIWDDFHNTIDTLHYQIKDSIESVLSVSAKDTIYRIEYFKRMNDNDPWQMQGSKSIIKSQKKLLLNDENLIYCKMAFPLSASSHWNEYNAIDSALFYQTHYATTNIINNNVKNTDAFIAHYKTDINLNDKTFHDCITINLHQFASLINADSEQEVYAPYIGLISQKIIHTESKAKNGVFYIYNGFIREISLSDYKQ
ncbi:MAG: hypothetical protein J6Y47_04515 [Bacteroidales bacterium]|nr:hypothetical protein [Bacteroidales bacterium]